MEETISLRELFQTLKKRLSLIIIITIIATTVSGVVSFFLLTPIYQTSTQLLVNQSSNNEQAMYNVNDIRTNLELMNTYNVIIKSPRILELVQEELNLDRSVNSLNNQIQVSSQQNSQVLSITVQDEEPAMAVNIANTVANVFQRELPGIMNVDNVSVLAAAQLAENPSPIKPRPALNMAIALVVGLMMGVGLAFLLEYLDNTIKTEQDIEKLLELPVLGAIPVMTDNDQKGTDITREKRGPVRSESVG
ncbi:YveK family protein [Sutcliffiella halmapala]|uniref:YveK family protein n=1 Tax=Sutcliffiella halmapala TaxID=79882 RepID=UPI000994C58C|nr:Wzz/FepE/Etk N-terminal domain-containing protein [Sutcliffiella halmapala]